MAEAKEPEKGDHDKGKEGVHEHPHAHFELHMPSFHHDKEGEDEEAGVEMTLKHLFTVQSLSSEAQSMKDAIVAEYATYTEDIEQKTGWFRAMIHLRRGLHTGDGGSPFWQSTREFRQKLIETMELPRFEVGIMFLILTDMVMVILEAVIDSVFVFGHGDHGGDHGGGHGDSHGGGHGDGHGAGHETGHATEHGGGHGESHGAGHETEHGAGHGAATHEDHATVTHAPEHGSGTHSSSEHGSDGTRRLRMIVRTVTRPVIRGWVQDAGRLLSSAGEGSCDAEQAQDVASTCRIISIVILFIFMTEILTKFCCAPKAFCSHLGHWLDVVVVLGSIIFEFTLHHSFGGLLIFFRCWRGVRIMHGLYEQVEYICKALETEKHLEKALKTVDKYKAYTELRHLRNDWTTFKKKGEVGLEHSGTIVVIEKEGDTEETKALLSVSAEEGKVETETVKEETAKAEETKEAEAVQTNGDHSKEESKGMQGGVYGKIDPDTLS